MITRSHIHSDKPERVEAFLQNDFDWHSRVLPVCAESPDITMTYWKGEQVILGVADASSDQVIRARVPASMVLVHLPLDHDKLYRLGRQALTATPDQAVLLPANHGYTLRSMPGRAVALVVNTDRLAAELDAYWPGRRGHVVVKAQEIPLPGRLQRRRMFALLRRWRQLAELHPGNQEKGPAARALESLCISWLAERIALKVGFKPLSPRSRMRLERIVAWIDKHLAEPICMADLEKISGIGSRGLNRICIAGCGMAPMELVHNRRLGAAQRLLRNGNQGTRVSKVALDCGFTHLSRFAETYEAAFGELPSDTIQRSRRINKPVI